MGNHGEESRDALRPHLVLSGIPALELHHSSPFRLQPEVPPLLPVLEQVPPRPRRHVFQNIHHHICTKSSLII